MGTRTNLLFEHDVLYPHDREAVIRRLAPTLAATIAVRDYWNSVTPDQWPDQSEVWTASKPCAPPRDWWILYEGPGPFFLRFGPAVANVRAAARWRGFLSIEPLRRIHVLAFRSIARTLGARRIVYLPDDDNIIWDATHEGASLDSCLAALDRGYGPPQRAIEAIEPDVVRMTDHRAPDVWYLETLDAQAERRNDKSGLRHGRQA